MNRDMIKVAENPNKGICSFCDDALICRLQRRQDRPIFFCEEYWCESSTQKGRLQESFEFIGRYPSGASARGSEKAGLAYIGLCSTCLNLPACALLKPGGGTWQCEMYAEDARGRAR